jgi:hypothetical protein
MPTDNPDTSATAALPYSLDYPPPDFIDPVIEAYKKDIDRTIIRENLKLTVEGRFQKYKSFLLSRAAWSGAASRNSQGRVAMPTAGDAK